MGGQRGKREPSKLTCPGAVALVQHPLIAAEGAVEPHGVVQGGGEASLVFGVWQQDGAKEGKIRHIGGDAAVQLHVTFTCTRTNGSASESSASIV